MKPFGDDAEVEALLERAARARLPLRHQLVLYLNPFALFKDAALGSASMRERALSYNRAMRWMLLPYVRRWVLITLASFAGIAPAEALAAESSLFIIPAAATAVSSCVAATVVVSTLAAYVLLGARGGRWSPSAAASVLSTPVPRSATNSRARARSVEFVSSTTKSTREEHRAMNLSTATHSAKRGAMSARAVRLAPKAHRGPAARVNAFADRLLYDGWLEDNRRDRMKLMMIRAIVEWAQASARN